MTYSYVHKVWAEYAQRNAVIAAFMDAHPGMTREEATKATRVSKA